MFKQNRLAIAVLAALASPMAANAVPLTIDVNGAGAGGTITGVTALDWSQANIIAVGENSGAAGVGGNQAIANFVNNAGNVGGVTDRDVSFQVLGHGTLGNFSNHSGNDLGLNTNYNWTFELGFGERVGAVIPAAGLALFDYAASSDGGTPFKNFFNIYYNPDPANPNDLTGDFFNNAPGSAAGTELVFSGTFTGDTTNAGGTPVTGSFDTDTSPGVPLDSFGAVDAPWANVLTVSGAGSNSALAIDAATAIINTDFIKSADFLTNLIANVSQVTPFTSLNPSTRFNLDGEGVTIGGVGNSATPTFANVGTFNGQLIVSVNGNGTVVATASASAFQFQTDFNQPVDVPAQVPTPASIALLGVGIGLLGAWRRRRYNA